MQVERQHPTVEGKVITKWIAPQDMGRLLRVVVNPPVPAGNSRLHSVSKIAEVDDIDTDEDMPDLVPAKCVYDYSKCCTGKTIRRKRRRLASAMNVQACMGVVKKFRPSASEDVLLGGGIP